MTQMYAIAQRLFLIMFVAGSFAHDVQTQTRITIAHNDNKSANSEFKFTNIPSPSRDDAATHARVLIVDGEADGNGADVTALTDGVLPTSGDQPRRNFFLTAGSGGARALIDLPSRWVSPPFTRIRGLLIHARP